MHPDYIPKGGAWGSRRDVDGRFVPEFFINRREMDDVRLLFREFERLFKWYQLRKADKETLVNDWSNGLYYHDLTNEYLASSWMRRLKKASCSYPKPETRPTPCFVPQEVTIFWMLIGRLNHTLKALRLAKRIQKASQLEKERAESVLRQRERDAEEIRWRFRLQREEKNMARRNRISSSLALTAIGMNLFEVGEYLGVGRQRADQIIEMGRRMILRDEKLLCEVAAKLPEDVRFLP